MIKMNYFLNYILLVFHLLLLCPSYAQRITKGIDDSTGKNVYVSKIIPKYSCQAQVCGTGFSIYLIRNGDNYKILIDISRCAYSRSFIIPNDRKVEIILSNSDRIKIYPNNNVESEEVIYVLEKDFFNVDLFGESCLLDIDIIELKKLKDLGLAGMKVNYITKNSKPLIDTRQDKTGFYFLLDIREKSRERFNKTLRKYIQRVLDVE